jgi:hypothetical protein
VVAVFEVRHDTDRFVLYFDTPRKEVDAYALASALVGLADAVREANAVVNPGYHVEVVVEAFSDGSFKATVRTVFKSARNLFSNQALQAVLWGVISTHIYEIAFREDSPPIVIVTVDLVTIEFGGNKIVVPKNVHEAHRQLANSRRFNAAIGQVFQSAISDPSIEGVGLGEDGNDETPPPLVPREKFPLFLREKPLDEQTREIVEVAQLEISRAILERGTRRWQLFWRGVKIAAPILDEEFFNRFFAHEITIAPGDALEVVLRIVQERNPNTGIFVNVRYEVLEVFGHVPRLKQGKL